MRFCGCCLFFVLGVFVWFYTKTKNQHQPQKHNAHPRPQECHPDSQTASSQSSQPGSRAASQPGGRPAGRPASSQAASMPACQRARQPARRPVTKMLYCPKNTNLSCQNCVTVPKKPKNPMFCELWSSGSSPDLSPDLHSSQNIGFLGFFGTVTQF